jgi:hypothetical protein
MKEPSYSETGSRLRISGSFYRKSGHTALESRPGIDISTLKVPGLSGNAQEATPVFSGRATLLSGAELEGIWHYSASPLEHFTEDEAAKRKGKFGKGTYFGAGELSGETVDLLRSGDTIKHDTKFTGNILAVPRDNVLGIASQLETANGLPQSRLKSSIQNAPLTDLLETIDIAGQKVDAVLITMREGSAAELAVLPRSIANISIVSPES